ncbi:MAG: glycosyltransferase family 9 protein [Clostridia bacterium]
MMKVAVVRALQLGDLLCAVPALRALRGAYPDAHIAFVGLPWAREFVARFFRYLDAFIEFPGFPGLPERECAATALPDFFAGMRAQRFDLAIQLHGSGQLMNPLTMLMGAARNAGFYAAGHYCPDPDRFVEWRAEEHEVLRWLRLLERMGVTAKGTQLEFPLAEQDLREFQLLRLADLPYAVVHPGSQLPSRRWPLERFAEVADALAAEGLRVVLTGSRSEAELTARLRAAMREPAIDLAGRTSLGALAAVIGRARLLVSNDTGVSHIAAAMRTPSVIIACGSDPKRWAPLNRELHRVLSYEVDCRPCAHRECPIGHPCALGVTVDEVLAEAWRLARCAA